MLHARIYEIILTSLFRYEQFYAYNSQALCFRHVAMATLTLSKPRSS